ncbi:MAG: DUF411 domain-containing protein [Rhodothermales bacterium]|nr:DUF411 domain-containing protein [Rhodothermales bacterium]MBO6778746.1 DUF411 domain-containing protein [Rhodothermales bacterium]
MSARSIVIGAIVLLAGAAYLFLGVESEAVAANTVVVYKSPTCGCCAAWIDHMEDSGYEVEVHDLNDVSPVKDREGVYPQLRSCHTATVGGYVLEGHVPAEHVTRLLAEQPAIRGLAVPGMPIGSPGMEQGDPADYDTYDVVAFTNEGELSVFARVQGGENSD